MDWLVDLLIDLLINSVIYRSIFTLFVVESGAKSDSANSFGGLRAEVQENPLKSEGKNHKTLWKYENTESNP